MVMLLGELHVINWLVGWLHWKDGNLDRSHLLSGENDRSNDRWEK